MTPDLLQYSHHHHHPMRYPVNCSASPSVWTLRLNPITGTARVRWFSTPLTEYRHTDISRRAILSLLWNSKGVSMGQWVNRHCLQRHLTVTV